MKRYSAVELFAGAGGLALGIEEAGFDSLGAIEIDKYASATLAHNRPNWNVVNEDIKLVNEKGFRNFSKVPKETTIDLVSGGFPCQSFSYAGKRLGLEDTRGTLFYEFAKFVKANRPRVFLAENVKGLVSHDYGRTLKTILNLFSEIGYSVTFQVLNSWDYGVAQKRHRVFIFGVRTDLIISKNLTFIFPEKIFPKKTLKDVLINVPKSECAKYGARKKKVLELVPPGGCWKALPTKVAKEYMLSTYFMEGGKTGIARRLSWDEPSLSILCSPSQKQTERCHPSETRPLSIRESARIQGFPDSWIFQGSLANQYKQIGNAVPVGLASAMGKAIIHFLKTLDQEKNGARKHLVPNLTSLDSNEKRLRA